MEDNVLHLDVWAGDWDLPSVDSNCLATLAYCKFSGVPVKVHKNTNPWKSPSRRFPVMKHNDVCETKVPNIFSYLRKQNWGSDFNLSNKQSADVVAFAAMLEQKLLPALLHHWWIESDTYVNLTRPMYITATPLPLKFSLVGNYCQKAKDRLYLGQGTDNLTDMDIDRKVYIDAKECITVLSQKLGDQNYFFGSSPSSLDALVFGYIAPLLKAPLNSNPLTTDVRKCDNLSLHCSRILREFFPLTPEEIEAKQKKEKKKNEQESDNGKFPNKARDMVLAGVFAATSMIVYCFISGIIHIDIERNVGDENISYVD